MNKAIDRRVTQPGRFGSASIALLILGACGGGPETSRDDARGQAVQQQANTGSEHGSVRVTLSEAAHRMARITIEVVTASREAARSVRLEVPGQVALDSTRVAVVSARVEGLIERFAVATGERVPAGAPVAWLFSREFLVAERDFLRAAERVRAVAGTEEEAGARALAEAAHQRLRLLGMIEDDIARLEARGVPEGLVTIRAPFAGSILDLYAVQGAAVQPGQALARVADLSTVQVVAAVSEEHIASVRVGTAARMRLAAYGDRPFHGRVTRLHDELDPATRRLRAFITVPNPERLLKPGMFTTVTLDAVGSGAARLAGLVIPASAVVTDGGDRYVFVEVAPRTYERRRVELQEAPISELGIAAPGRVVVRRGIAPGDRLVVLGAFTLKSELGKAAFGEND